MQLPRILNYEDPPELSPSSSTLLRLKLMLKLLSQLNERDWTLIVFSEISKPRFLIFPIFFTMLLKPDAYGNEAFNNKLEVFFSYTSTVSINLFSNKARSNPRSVCAVVSPFQRLVAHRRLHHSRWRAAVIECIGRLRADWTNPGTLQSHPRGYYR